MLASTGQYLAMPQRCGDEGNQTMTNTRPANFPPYAINETPQARAFTTPRREALFIGDNGRVFCRLHGGATFRATGRDLSGQRVHRVSAADHAEALAMGWTIKCESCAALAKVDA